MRKYGVLLLAMMIFVPTITFFSLTHSEQSNHQYEIVPFSTNDVIGKTFMLGENGSGLVNGATEAITFLVDKSGDRIAPCIYNTNGTCCAPIMYWGINSDGWIILSEQKNGNPSITLKKTNIATDDGCIFSRNNMIVKYSLKLSANQALHQSP